MGMTRFGFIPLIVPHNQRIPVGPQGFAIPFHGSEAASPGFTPLTKIFSGAGAPAANEWTADKYAYTYPIGNGGTPKVAWNSDPDLSSDSQMALDLLDMEPGAQTIVAFSVVQPAEVPASNDFILTYGNNQAAESFWAIGRSSSSRLLLANWRTVADGASAAQTLNDVSGTSFGNAAFNAIKTWVAFSVRLTSELDVVFEAAYSNGTQSGTSARSATFNGTRPGRTADTHKGVTIGARTDGATYTNHFGISGTTAGRLGSFYVRRWLDSDITRNASIVADMLERPNECPTTMLT